MILHSREVFLTENLSDFSISGGDDDWMRSNSPYVQIEPDVLADWKQLPCPGERRAEGAAFTAEERRYRPSDRVSFRAWHFTINSNG